MKFLDLISRRIWLNAISLIAFCAVSTAATAQNASQVNAEKTDEQTERIRIKSERAALAQSLDQQRQACYQKLAVTPCLNAARDEHNEKMRDLKRQEIALNDAQRKRAAADRVKALDARNSPEVQLQRAQDRGKALDASGRREGDRAQKQAARESRLAEAAKAAQTEKQAKPKAAVPSAQGKPRPQSTTKIAPAQRAGQAERMAKSREQAAKREQDAAERRAKVAEREAKRKKPPAAGLPIPEQAK